VKQKGKTTAATTSTTTDKSPYEAGHEGELLFPQLFGGKESPEAAKRRWESYNELWEEQEKRTNVRNVWYSSKDGVWWLMRAVVGDTCVSERKDVGGGLGVCQESHTREVPVFLHALVSALLHLHETSGSLGLTGV